MLPQSRLQTLQWWRSLIDEAERRKINIDSVRRRLAQQDLFYLLVRVLGRLDINRDWVFARCREVQLSPDGHLDLWAREHFKSSIITYGLTIQEVLKDPEITVGIFSHTRPIAKGFLRQIKREFESDEDLKRLFPDVLWANPAKEAPKWSEDEGIIVKRKGNPKEATIEASGLVDGQPTSKHYRLRVYDDVVTRESVTTPEMIKKTTEAWELSDNLGTHDGAARYIGTRYSLHDTYATMLERGVVKPRIYPATSNGRLDGVPVLLTPEQWEAKKNLQRSTLAAQMLQNPLAAADATFDAIWLKPYEVRPATINVYIMVDPSKGRSATSDNTAIAVVGVSSADARFLLDGYCHRMSLSQRYEAVCQLYNKWSATKGVRHIEVGYERYGAQTDDEYFREKLENAKGKQAWFEIKELNWANDSASQSKQDRVERLEPDFRNGRFFLPLAVWHENKPSQWAYDVDKRKIVYAETAGLTRAQQNAIDAGRGDLVCRAIKRLDEEKRPYDLTVRFIEEYETFPFGTHDDLVDATSRLYDMMPRPPIGDGSRSVEPGVYLDS